MAASVMAAHGRHRDGQEREEILEGVHEVRGRLFGPPAVVAASDALHEAPPVREGSDQRPLDLHHHRGQLCTHK
eukprot:scaffold112061_cov39-Prasinocladus_malaysianus.AAC.1